MNHQPRYGAISTLNHWITVILVVAMFTLGYSAHEAPREAARFLMGAHIGLGFFTFFFIIWRVGFRLYEGFPKSAESNPAFAGIARIVHWLLLLTLLVLVISGPLHIFTGGHELNVFGWFSIASPTGEMEGINDFSGELHEFLASDGLLILLGLHFLGAIHYFWTRRQATPADM